MTASGRLAVIGDPVAGSLSPAIHNAAITLLRLDLEYLAIQVPASELGSVFPGLADRFLGLNVTRPLKERVVDFCSDLSAEAALARSVNTIAFRDGLTHGASTDVGAFMPAIREVTDRSIHRAVVLGSGGAARAAVVALLKERATVDVIARNEAAGRRLAYDLGVSVGTTSSNGTKASIERADLLVNATPVGSEVGGSPVPDRAPLPSHGIVFDLVYRPRITPLLQRARAEGCECVDGLRLLVEQAALSFETWTGMQAPRDVMRAGALKAMDAPIVAATVASRFGEPKVV
jgi:shikimate dehydrogenase